MYLALGIVIAVVTAVVAAVLAVVAVGLLLRWTAAKAVIPWRGGFGLMVFSDKLDGRLKILIGVSLVFCFFGLSFVFVPVLGAGREGAWAFPLMLLAIRQRLRGYALVIDTKRLCHDPLKAGARMIYWARLASVRLVGQWLVLTDVLRSQLHVNRYLVGLGALARHIDEHAPPSVEIDGRSRELLLEAYRRGLVESGEDPDQWFEERNGPLTQYVKRPERPADDETGVVRARRRA